MRLFAAVAVISLMPLSAARADVYRSIDAQGHVLYSDTPTPGAQLVRNSIGPNGPGSSTLNTPAPAPKPAAATKSDSGVSDPVAEQAAARAVQNDMAQNRAEQCKKAKETYENSVLARRIYTAAPDGSRQYLSDDEAEQQRINNKLQMDQLCKDQAASSQ